MTTPSPADVGDGTALPPVTIRRLVAPVYLPMILGTLGFGILIPVLPLYLTDSGISLRDASIVLAGAGLGAALGSLPIGSFLARAGERTTLLVSLLALAVLTPPLGLTTVAATLFALRAAAGAASAALRLSRQTYIARRVVAERRGRSMAMIGGSYRVSLLIGPLTGGWLVDTVGFTNTFVIAGVVAGLGLVPALVVGADHIAPRPDVDRIPQFGVIEALRRHGAFLLVAGVVPLLVMAAREGRFVVLPLISDDLGLSATAIGAVVSVGTGADLLLFPVAGWVMDRFGRLFAIVPAFSLIAVGLVMLGVAGTTTEVVVAGAVIGIGNGLSAGTMLTYGSDLAPADSTGPFLAGLAAMQDAGRVVGPLVVGVVGASAGLGAAAFALAGLLMTAVLWIVVLIGETSRHQHDTPGSDRVPGDR